MNVFFVWLKLPGGEKWSVSCAAKALTDLPVELLVLLRELLPLVQLAFHRLVKATVFARKFSESCINLFWDVSKCKTFFECTLKKLFWIIYWFWNITEFFYWCLFFTFATATLGFALKLSNSKSPFSSKLTIMN